MSRGELLTVKVYTDFKETLMQMILVAFFMVALPVSILIPLIGAVRHQSASPSSFMQTSAASASSASSAGDPSRFTYLPNSDLQEFRQKGELYGDIVVPKDLDQAVDNDGVYKIRVRYSMPSEANSWGEEGAKNFRSHVFKSNNPELDEENMPTTNLVQFRNPSGATDTELTIPAADFENGVIAYTFFETNVQECKEIYETVDQSQSVIAVTGKAVRDMRHPPVRREELISASDVSQSSPALSAARPTDGSRPVVTASYSNDGKILGFSDVYTEVKVEVIDEGNGRTRELKTPGAVKGRRPWEKLTVGEEYSVRPGTTFRVGSDIFRIARVAFSAPPEGSGFQDDAVANFYSNFDESGIESSACVFCLGDEYYANNPAIFASTRRTETGYDGVAHCGCLQNYVYNQKSTEYGSRNLPLLSEIDIIHKAAQDTTSGNELASETFFRVDWKRDWTPRKQSLFVDSLSIDKVYELFHTSTSFSDKLPVFANNLLHSKVLQKRQQERAAREARQGGQDEAEGPVAFPKSREVEVGGKYGISINDIANLKMKYMHNLNSRVDNYREGGTLMMRTADENLKKEESRILLELLRGKDLASSADATKLEEERKLEVQEMKREFEERIEELRWIEKQFYELGGDRSEMQKSLADRLTSISRVAPPSHEAIKVAEKTVVAQKWAALSKSPDVPEVFEELKQLDAIAKSIPKQITLAEACKALVEKAVKRARDEMPPRSPADNLLFPARLKTKFLTSQEREDFRREQTVRMLAVGQPIDDVVIPATKLVPDESGDTYTGLVDATKMHKIVRAPYIVLEVGVPADGQKDLRQTVFLKVELDRWFSLGRGPNHDFKFNAQKSLSRENGVMLMLTSSNEIRIKDSGETFGVNVKAGFDEDVDPNSRWLTKKDAMAKRPKVGPMVNPLTGYSQSALQARRIPGKVTKFESHGFEWWVQFQAK